MIPQGILSQEAELALLGRIEFLIIKELGISLVTLHEWERLGLIRYCPPIEGTRKVFYKKSDVMKFLSTTKKE